MAPGVRRVMERAKIMGISNEPSQSYHYEFFSR